MAKQKVVHRLVPLACPLIKTHAVPPVLVKVSVSKSDKEQGDRKKKNDQLSFLSTLNAILSIRIIHCQLAGIEDLPTELCKGVADTLKDNVEDQKVVHHEGYQEQDQSAQRRDGWIEHNGVDVVLCRHVEKRKGAQGRDHFLEDVHGADPRKNEKDR